MYPELASHPHIYSKNFPSFGRPKVEGFIGYENIRFCKNVKDEPCVSYDLNLLLEEGIHKPLVFDVKLTELLQFLVEHENNHYLPITNTLDEAQFLCFRGLLTYVASTPYENQEPWKIVAVLYKGAIYLCHRRTESQLERNKNMSDKEVKCTYWGHKFEQFILSDSPGSNSNPNRPVNEYEEFSLVFSSHLNQHNILFGAEMDGIRCDGTPVLSPPPIEKGEDVVLEYLSNQHFIELKTNRLIESSRQENIFRRFKAKKWWLQSYFVGIEDILCGFRNDDGIVEQLKVINLKELAEKSHRFWKPNVCINFLDEFLTYVKRCFARDIRRMHGERYINKLQKLPMMSLMFEWEPGRNVRVSETYKHEDDPILSQWFLDRYRKHES